VHVTLTRVSTGDHPIENATLVAEEMLGWLRDMEGFKGLLFLSRPGETLGMSFWESREAAELRSEARREFVERMSAVVNVRIEERVDYELTFADFEPGLEQLRR
jgi:hypothetical protein